MSEEELSSRVRCDFDAQADPELTASWYEAWYQAWEWVEAQGGCDTFGSREFARLTARARVLGLGIGQTEMRCWIRQQANLPPVTSVTERSLAWRQARARKRGQVDG